MKQLNPSLTIPMHFRTPVMGFPIETEEPFLKLVGGGRRAGSMEIEVKKESLRAQAGVVVLAYPR
jgi:L-ascorbate metabolism protein UlaG (beta-lactamase superfamily)